MVPVPGHSCVVNAVFRAHTFVVPERLQLKKRPGTKTLCQVVRLWCHQFLLLMSSAVLLPAAR